MFVAFPFHKGDRERAKLWLEWVAELGGCQSHSLLLIPAKEAGENGDMLTIARASWGSVGVLPDGEGITGWPQGPNSNMRQLVWHMWHNKIGPVFHLENDCIPRCSGWLDQIEADYQTALAAGKVFLGQVVRPGDNTPVHLTGNMVMPWDAVIHAPALSQRGLSTTGDELAFDITAAPQILPKACDSKLIQQVWNTNGEPPTFPDQESLSILREGSVLFHRCKDGSLIDRLREKPSNSVANQPFEFIPHPEGEYEDTLTGQRLKYISGDDMERNRKALSAILNPAAKVYTYFSPVESEEGQAEQQRILSIWRAQWSANGWEPVVLTEEDAKRHPDCESLRAHFASLPTINRPGYEMACWLRWVAMAAIPGHHLMVDYDCLPFGCKPGDWISHEDGKYPIMLSGDPKVPFAVVGLQHQFQNTLALFCAFDAAKMTHISDMLMLQEALSGPPDSPCSGVFAVAKERGAELWKSAPIVHFGHFSCHPRLRSEVMAEEVAARSIAPARAVSISPASIPATLAEQFRSLSAAMVKLIDGKPGRKAQLQTELRNAGLIGAAKTRAKRKNKKV